MDVAGKQGRFAENISPTPSSLFAEHAGILMDSATGGEIRVKNRGFAAIDSRSIDVVDGDRKVFADDLHLNLLRPGKGFEDRCVFRNVAFMQMNGRRRLANSCSWSPKSVPSVNSTLHVAPRSVPRLVWSPC